MKTRPNEILVMYDAASSKARQTVALAHTLGNYVQEWDFSKRPLTTTQWRGLLSMMQLEPKQLLDKSLPYYQEHIRGREFDDEGWLNVLRRNTDLISGPIAIHQDRAVLCKTPTEILSLVQKSAESTVTVDLETATTELQ